MPQSPEEKKRQLELRLSAIGYQFAVSIALCALLGQWIDRRFDTTPWALIIGIVLGATAAFTDLFRLTRQLREMESSS